METYNSRIIKYATEQQITFYKKSITREKEKNEKLQKGIINESRTEKQESECKRISINQTKNRIYQLARANTWEWFITMTFDRNKTDSSDYQEIIDSLHKFLNNLRMNYAPELIYLIVPELHADGKHYHFHGLLANTGNLQFKYSGHIDHKSGRPIYNIVQWKLGFTTATRVTDTAKVSGYITKYITKECCSVLKNKKRYYVSHNINRPEIIYTVLNEEEFQAYYGDKIKYCKSISVPQSGQGISYYELDYDT